jgi:hypothetical protein
VTRIFEHKREVVAGGRRKLHNEERHILYVLPNILRISTSRMKWP